MGVRRIILHIGRHKSGTSSLQHYFAKQRPFLDGCGVLYPVAGTRKNGLAHHKLSHMCHTGRTGGENIDSIASAVRSEIEPHHDTILLSSEEFQNLATTKWIKRFLSYFPRAAVDIICYVREFADYMVSSFRQAVQNQHKFQTFTTFCKNRYPAKGFIRRWRKIGNLQMGWFHPNLLKDRDIISDFLEKARLSKPADFAIQNHNPSLGGNLLWMKLAANHAHSLFIPYGDMTRLMLKRASFTRPFYFSTDRANALRQVSSYNKVFEKALGPVPLKTWDDGIHLPDLSTLQDDINFIKNTFSHYDFSQMGLDPKLGKDWF